MRYLQSFVVYTDAANQAAMLQHSRVTSSGHLINNYVSYRWYQPGVDILCGPPPRAAQP